MDQINQQDCPSISPGKRAAAFAVHIFTAAGAGIALIALLEGGPGLMLAVVAVYCLINFVIQSVIQPRVI